MQTMASILIAYATVEGQTARICDALAQQLRAMGHAVDLIDLASRKTAPAVLPQDAVIIASSVHAGRHQDVVVHFAREHADVLRSKSTAFLSVGMAVVAAEQSGRQRADEQVQSFLKQVDWTPDFIERLGGAFRYSDFSRLKRWVFRLSQRLFRKELQRQGWPNLAADQEFTDWDAVRRFGETFGATL